MTGLKTSFGAEGVPGWLWAAGLCLLILIPYLNSFDGDFVFDAGEVILNDERIEEVTPAHLRAIWTQDYWSPYILGLYRPLTTTSFWLNYAVLGNGDDPFGYHVLNFLIHAANCLLVWELLRRLGGGFRMAWFGAVLYGLHPVQTEAVTNLVGRSDLLACLFVLAGFLIHLENVRRGPSMLRRLALSLCFLGGLLSKEVALVLIGVIFWYEFCFRREHLLSRSTMWTAVSLLIPLLGIAAWRAYLYWDMAFPPISYTDNPIVAAEGMEGFLTAVRIMGFYLWLIVWPVRLSADYSYDQVPLVEWPPQSMYDWQAVGAGGLLAVIAILSLASIRRWPLPVFWTGFFFGTLLPASNLLKPVASIVGERFLYLPLVGVVGTLICLAGPGWDWVSGKRSPTAVRSRQGWLRTGAVMIGVAILIPLGLRTWHRNHDWQTNVTLFRSAIEVAPGSARNHGAYAAALYVAHENEGLEPVIDEIIHHGERAAGIIKTVPVRHRSVKAHLDLSRYYEEKARLLREEGEESGYAQYMKKSVIALEELVAWEMQNRKRDGSVEQAGNVSQRGVGYLQRRARVSRLLPHQIRTRMARLYHELGMNRDAFSALGQALALYPGSAEIYSDLGRYREEGGQLEFAAVAYLQAVILQDQAARVGGWEDVVRVFAKLGLDQLIREDDASGGKALDLSEAEAHAFLNTACLGIYRDYLQAARPKEARQFRDQAIQLFGRAPELFTEERTP